MTDNSYFRSEPVWGATQSPDMAKNRGVGPGLQAPEARQHAPQPGEAPELLPQFQGSEVEVREQNRRVRREQHVPSVERMAPYLLLNGTVFFNATSDNTVVLGRPNKGFKWSLRQLVCVPGSSLTDTSFIAASNFLAAVFAGNPPLSHPGGALTQVATLGDVVELFDKPNNATVAGSGFMGFAKTYGPNQIQILENQALYAQVLASGSNATTPILFLARVEQFPVGKSTRVEEV